MYEQDRINYFSSSFCLLLVIPYTTPSCDYMYVRECINADYVVDYSVGQVLGQTDVIRSTLM